MNVSHLGLLDEFVWQMHATSLHFIGGIAASTLLWSHVVLHGSLALSPIWCGHCCFFMTQVVKLIEVCSICNVYDSLFWSWFSSQKRTSRTEPKTSKIKGYMHNMHNVCRNMLYIWRSHSYVCLMCFLQLKQGAVLPEHLLPTWVQLWTIWLTPSTRQVPGRSGYELFSHVLVDSFDGTKNKPLQLQEEILQKLHISFRMKTWSTSSLS